MSNTNDKTAKSHDPKAPEVEVSVKITEDLLISDSAVARIQAIYDKFVKAHFPDNENDELFADHIADDLKQETAVAVLEALMSMPDDSIPNQAELYGIVSAYLEQWLDAQSGNAPNGYISLQEIMASMYHVDSGYQDVDRFCDHCKKVINIYNSNGGTIHIVV